MSSRQPKPSSLSESSISPLSLKPSCPQWSPSPRGTLTGYMPVREESQHFSSWLPPIHSYPALPTGIPGTCSLFLKCSHAFTPLCLCTYSSPRGELPFLPTPVVYLGPHSPSRSRKSFSSSRLPSLRALGDDQPQWRGTEEGTGGRVDLGMRGCMHGNKCWLGGYWAPLKEEE